MERISVLNVNLNKMKRIVICDDHPLITQGIYSYLQADVELEILGSASTALELKDLLKQVEADIILMDIQLPDQSGIELCTEVKQQYPDLKILGLSNLDDRNIILNMLNAGANGYVLKSAPLEEIKLAIDHIYDGGIYLGESVQKCLAMGQSQQEEIPPVTRKEKEVLAYLAQGLSSIQIADIMFVSPLTVDTHRRNLMLKFKTNKTVNLLQKVKDLGILK